MVEDPGTVLEGCGVVTFDFADVKELSDNGLVCLVLLRASDASIEKRAETWPVAGTTVAKANMPAGEYLAVVQVGDENGTLKQFMAYGEDGWVLLDGKDPETIKAASKVMTVEEGKTLEIPTDGFKSVATEAFSTVEQMLQELAGA